MMQASLHPTPPGRDVVREQVRVVGLSLRREALVLAVVLAIATLPLLNEIVRGGPGFDSSDSFPTPLVSFLIPFAVWRGERRFGPSLFWTVPVDRRRLALARVFAGGVWMMAALAFYVSWLLALALLAHAPAAEIFVRVPFIATIGAYLFGSALVLGLRHPLRWLLGGAAVVVLVAHFIQPYELRPLLRSFFSATGDVAASWRALPDLTRSATATFLWLGGGLAALRAAVSRHGERRRR